MSRSVIGLHHPAIVVPDLEVAIRFYSEFSGFNVVLRKTWGVKSKINQIIAVSESVGKFAVLKGRYGYLELFEFLEPEYAKPSEPAKAFFVGIRHLCFQVSEVDTALKHLVDLGGTRMNDPVTNKRGVTSVYARDPFGNLVELLNTAGVIDGLEDL